MRTGGGSRSISICRSVSAIYVKHAVLQLQQYNYILKVWNYRNQAALWIRANVPPLLNALLNRCDRRYDLSIDRVLHFYFPGMQFQPARLVSSTVNGISNKRSVHEFKIRTDLMSCPGDEMNQVRISFEVGTNFLKHFLVELRIDRTCQPEPKISPSLPLASNLHYRRYFMIFCRLLTIYHWDRTAYVARDCSCDTTHSDSIKTSP